MSKTEEIVIKVSEVSKTFEMQSAPRKDSLREVISRKKTPIELARDAQIHSGEFTALKDISFQVKRGETFGIIGSNGAGKSTLLKILSQILRPTTGKIEIKGRVSSLLEVGTGFHSELTGRENVYFNGSLLGMTKQEIEAGFNDILDFSELGNFIDSPVKHYSSGMKARLGFAVAANLDAEIMIVDEALAVGDNKFRDKALAKMRDTAESGKTVLFVTHSMSFIRNVCDRTMLLTNGQIEMIGDTDSVVDRHLEIKQTKEITRRPTWSGNKKNPPPKKAYPIGLQLAVNGKVATTMSVKYDDRVAVRCQFKTSDTSSSVSLGVALFDEKNRKIWRQAGPAGKTNFPIKIPLHFLIPGTYYLGADVDIRNEGWIVNPARTPARIYFTITDDNPLIWDVNREGLIKPKTS